jgi:serine/threonine-protein kinase
MADPLVTEARRTYTILGLIGEGGSGRVYRARMSEGDFHKDVALKMLHEGTPSDTLLARFRDEARILALFRDRAVVSVEPPVQLAGRWCVVMDFVEGQSLAQLLRQQGPLPPTVALEIVAEVARVLRNAYDFPGPRGAPLRLLHRDLKPGNLQVTRSGEVRILDFGSAKASFAHREADTLEEISGTPGFIAPERLDGEETPAGDIYSLGVTLWMLLTGEPSIRRWDDATQAAQELAGDDPSLAAALGVAARMRERDPASRPDAEEIQSTARALANALPGPGLEDWAARMPPRPLADDRMRGQRLTETVGLERRSVSNAGIVTMGLGGIVGSVLVGIVGVAAAIFVVLALGLLGRDDPTVVPKDADVVPPSEPVDWRPVPVPDGMVAVHLRSEPDGAIVWVDGREVGTTPIAGHVMKPGVYTVRMKRHVFDHEQQVVVEEAGSLMWRMTVQNSDFRFYPAAGE